MTPKWDPDALRAARERGRKKVLAAQQRRDLLGTTPDGYRGDRKAIALAMYGDEFPLHEIKRVTGLSPSVISELAAWAGLPRRARGVRPPGQRDTTPTVARVLEELDGARGTPALVAQRLGVSVTAVVAIHHRRPPPPPEPPPLLHRCPLCNAPHAGSACPNCTP
ncbi:MAG: hypothetical protein AB7N73_16180 [Gemmatimonadales bacterium]